MHPEEEKCGNCKFYLNDVFREDDTSVETCRRFPRTEKKKEDSWCGEWRSSNPFHKETQSNLRLQALLTVSDGDR